MKEMKVKIVFAVVLVFLAEMSAFAVDLTKFQGYMQARNGYQPVRAPRPSSGNSVGSVVSGRNIVPKLSYQDADAAYRYDKLTDLSRNRDERDELTLPAGTRIPESLRPLLADRTHPREGISLNGLSGSILVPSPGVLKVNKGALSVHTMPFDLYDVNDNKYTDELYYQTNVKLVFGAFEGFEIGIDKDFANQQRFDVPEPVFVNMKYQVPGVVTLGGNFCTDSEGGYHSVWVGAGVPAVWVGAGVNFGAREFRFSYNGYDKLARAKLGGYNYDYNKAEGYADPAFFFVGGTVPMTANSAFVYDFNGDRFSLGLRLNYQKIVFFDAAFVSDGDYERLPGAIAHKRIRNFVFGGSLVF